MASRVINFASGSYAAAGQIGAQSALTPKEQTRVQVLNSLLAPSHCCTRWVRCPAKRSELTGQQKCHTHRMENVTLTPKEQTRVQV